VEQATLYIAQCLEWKSDIIGTVENLRKAGMIPALSRNLVAMQKNVRPRFLQVADVDHQIINKDVTTIYSRCPT
jgi:hypothetical protein